MKVDERIAGTKQDRTEFNPPSAGERARSAETRRNASPENPKGRFRWFKPALGVTAAALGSIALGGTAVAVAVSEPGTTVGLALGAPLPEGVYFVDTSSDGGFRGVDDSLVYTVDGIRRACLGSGSRASARGRRCRRARSCRPAQRQPRRPGRNAL